MVITFSQRKEWAIYYSKWNGLQAAPFPVAELTLILRTLHFTQIWAVPVDGGRAFTCPGVDLLACVLWLCALLRMRLHFKRVNLDSPKYKPSSYPRVKCTPCLLSLGLATGAASSACRFLQKDWAPLRTGLLLMPYAICYHDRVSNAHTHTRAHTPPHRHELGHVGIKGSFKLSCCYSHCYDLTVLSYLCRPGRLCESVTASAGYELVDLRFLERI